MAQETRTREFSFSDEPLQYSAGIPHEQFLEALKEDPCSLQYIPVEVKHYRSLANFAITTGAAEAMRYVDPSLLNDRDFVIEVIVCNADALQYAPQTLQDDPFLQRVRHVSANQSETKDSFSRPLEYAFKHLVFPFKYILPSVHHPDKNRAIQELIAENEKTIILLFETRDPTIVDKITAKARAVKSTLEEIDKHPTGSKSITSIIGFLARKPEKICSTEEVILLLATCEDPLQYFTRDFFTKGERSSSGLGLT